MHSFVQCVWVSQKAVEVGRRRGEDGERIKEEEDRGEMVAQSMNWMIKEAEAEKKMGNSRYERQLNC